MEIDPIRSDADHERTLREIENLWGASPGTPEGDKLDVLITLAEAWERAQHLIDPPDPIDAIRFRLEQLGLDTRALEGILGSRGRVSEVLNRKRPLTLRMIRRLVAEFDIPASVLIQESPKADRRQTDSSGRPGVPQGQGLVAATTPCAISTRLRCHATIMAFRAVADEELADAIACQYRVFRRPDVRSRDGDRAEAHGQGLGPAPQGTDGLGLCRRRQGHGQLCRRA